MEGSDRLKIYDISNPQSSQLISTTIIGDGPRSIYVSGRYAYIANYNGNTMQVFNISNPSSPTLSGSINTNVNPRWIYVAGHYAYITNQASNNFQIFDVSNPASPKMAGLATTNNGPRVIFISGRYAYVTNNSSNTLQIFNISGLETTSANIHSLEAGNLQVRNDIIAQGQLQITGGINVGTGGIFSAGPIGVSISSTTQTDAISAYFQGRVGIATTTPQQALEVNGGIRLFTSDTQPNCDATNGPKNNGTLWHIQGVNDQLQICAASSSVYAWRPL